MNCILFDEPPPFKLDESDPRLAHVLGCLKIPEGGEIFAGKINSFMCVARIRYLRGAGALLEPIRPLPDPRPKNITFCAAFTRPQIAQRILFECSCFGVKNVIFYAAQKGDAQAEGNLGACYYNGIGVERNVLKGVELIRSAAKKGNEEAQKALARIRGTY